MDPDLEHALVCWADMRERLLEARERNPATGLTWEVAQATQKEQVARERLYAVLVKVIDGLPRPVDAAALLDCQPQDQPSAVIFQFPVDGRRVESARRRELARSCSF